MQEDLIKETKEKMEKSMENLNKRLYNLKEWDDILTEERRKELIKQVKGICEDGKVAVRNIRHDAIGDAKDLELSEDELKGVENRIQELVNTYNKKIDEYLKQKEQELLTV